MGSIAGFVEAVLFGRLSKAQVMVIDIKFIISALTFSVSGIAHINIKPAVVVDVRHNYACIPVAFAGNTRFFGYILKLPVPFIQVEGIAAHIGAKENVGQTVVIDIAYGNSGAIVEISIAENIKIARILYFVLEVDTGIFLKGKQSSLLPVRTTGKQKQNKRQANPDFHGSNKFIKKLKGHRSMAFQFIHY
jgi:hypothetical protein